LTQLEAKKQDDHAISANSKTKQGFSKVTDP
jgi:hypothetical protein